jgi:ribonuclease E
MKRILFNATHAEELRVAIVDGQKLIDLDLESSVRAQKKGNIYKCVVTRVEPSLEAAFVNYGADRHGFLPFKEIYRGYFQNYSSNTPLSKVNIKDVIKEGQELIVQVEKDERGNKGAALTTFISLAGRFLVLMPNNPKGGGISRRVEGQERTDLKQALDSLNIPSEHAIIARTAALSRTEEELKWDFDFLLQLWEAIEDAATNCKAPTLIYQESNLIVRAIRDYLNASVQEVVIDDKEIYERAHRFVQQVMPQNLNKIKFYEDPTPLYSRYQIESQIASAFSRDVQLPSGGSIVIDHTEALIAVDVNSARATKGGDIEETALQTNLEAVEEIARQLRIRDIGGLVVLDLIDMGSNSNQRKVEARLKDSLSYDRARVQVGRISRFGLLEMSRQRIRSSIDDANYHTCPRCEGTGHIRSIVSNSLNLLRLIEEEALKENTESLQVFLPVDSAAYLLNEKRRELSQLESRLATRVTVVPTIELQSPHFQIKRLRSSEIDEISQESSHQLKPEVEKEDLIQQISATPIPAEKPMIGFEQMTPSSPPPARAAAGEPALAPQRDVGLFTRLWGALTGNDADKEQTAAEPTKEEKPKRPPRSNQNRGQSRGQNNRSRNDSREGKPNDTRGRKPNSRGGRTPNNKPVQETDQTANGDQNAQSQTKDNSVKVESNAEGNTGGNATRKPNNRRPRDNTKPNNGRRRNTNNQSRTSNSRSPKTDSESAGNVKAPEKKAAVVSDEPNGNVK